MTALSALEHRLVVVTSAGDRPVVTSLPRGRERGHVLHCGDCDGEVALDRAPMPAPAPLLRCGWCGALNDLTRQRPAQS